MTFANPYLLYLLILIPLLGLFTAWTARRKQTALNRLGNPDLLARLSLSVNRRGRRRQTGLWFVALILLIMALARPQWGSEVQSVTQQGIEIMVALDVSQSMLAEDIKPNRLSRAKLEITDLMDHLTGNEMGLVLFSGAAFIQFPLTSDFATARTFLESAYPGVISQPGTNIESAVNTALNGFNWQQASQKVIVIITDGENHNTDPLQAARAAAEKGVIIYTIGIGSPQGNPIPLLDAKGDITGYKKDRQGETVLSKLDEVTLQQIALAANGQYFRAAAGKEIDALIAQLDTLQKTELESRFETLRIERFQGFLLPALAAMIIIEIIPDRKRGK